MDVVLLSKVVSLAARTQYVNITCDNLVSIYRGEREARVMTSVMGKQLEEIASMIRQREELPPLAQGKGRHPPVSLSRSALSLPLHAARLPHPVQSHSARQLLYLPRLQATLFIDPRQTRQASPLLPLHHLAPHLRTAQMQLRSSQYFPSTPSLQPSPSP